MAGPLVSAAWLTEHHADADLSLLDFRWYLDGRSGLAAYAAGHIPGAVFVDMASVTGRRTDAGRHPLPEPADFQLAMRKAGVGRRSPVVVYDDQGGMTAARLWFLLRFFGHGQVALLDGGLQAWPHELSREPARVAPGDFEAEEPRAEWVLDYALMGSRPAGTVLVDARAPDRFSGETEPIDPRAGHIPGARNAPWGGNLERDGRFLPAERLRERFLALGAEGENTVNYCGSGVSACHNLLALELAGIPGARLYEGSWSDWSSRAEAPVETGHSPGSR